MSAAARHAQRLPLRLIARLSIGVLIATTSAALASGPAYASAGQETWLQDDGALLSDPAGTLTRLRQLGVDRLRLAVRWLMIAPAPNSRRRPRRFNAADPAAYPARNWSGWDVIVKLAHKDGIAVNFNVVGGAPLWATGPGAPAGAFHHSWDPSATDFGAFVHALAVRYGGNYDPATGRTTSGDGNDLPAIRFWSIWNEPNHGPNLAPQGRLGDLSVEHSPATYRRLLDAGWSALQSTGHGRDTILFGDVAPHGVDRFGVFSMMKPLRFLRALYCVDAGYRELRGQSAALRGCPTTAAGSSRFRATHPALFAATGFADHPYSLWFPPNIEQPNDPDYASLADIGNLAHALDRLQRVYGSRRRLPIWNSEYGYLTSPPKRSTRRALYVSAETAAVYLNQAEYLSWRNPRIQSFTQYLLADPLPALRSNDWGGYASGLLSYHRDDKATFSAWRLPLYLPVSTARSGKYLEVWGCARPAFFALQDVPGDPETVQVQFEPRGSRQFETLQSVPITDPHGYFDTHVPFGTSGQVRLSYTFPKDDALLMPGYTAYSREVTVAIGQP